MGNIHLGSARCRASIQADKPFCLLEPAKHRSAPLLGQTCARSAAKVECSRAHEEHALISTTPRPLKPTIASDLTMTGGYGPTMLRWWLAIRLRTSPVTATIPMSAKTR
jgi:hypothetical protein